MPKDSQEPLRMKPNATPYNNKYKPVTTQQGGGGSKPDRPTPEHPFDEVDRSFFRLGKKTTICLVTCRCGLELIGEAHCVDPDDYDPEIGKQFAYDDATGKRKEYEGVYNNAK